MNATLTKKEQKAQDTHEAIEYLRGLFDNDTKPMVGTILRHVSASGMSRDISLYYKDENITYWVAQALGENIRNSHGFNAIRYNGCGMDMGFYMVYNLSICLYGLDRGYTLNQRWL
jgi:hypothetical protein